MDGMKIEIQSAFARASSLPVLRLTHQDIPIVLWIHSFHHFTIKEARELREGQWVIARCGLLKS